MKVGINGMGRIGRLALRAAMGAADRQADDPYAENRLEIVHLNEHKGGAAATAHLLEFDSVQGRWRAGIVSTWCLSAPASCSPPRPCRAILTVVPSG